MVAITGPILAGLALLVGRLLGAQLGELRGIIAVAVLAVVLAFATQRWRKIGVATFLVFAFVGAMNAYVGDSFELLRSGAHIKGAHVAEIASWQHHERVTFGDGVELVGLTGLAGHSSGHNDSRRTTTRYACFATPIVAPGWTTGSPIRIWALAEYPTSTPYDQQTFHPIMKLDDDCTHAITQATSKHALVQAADPIYLERLDTVLDPYFLNLQGVVPAILCAVIWFLVIVSRRLQKS